MQIIINVMFVVVSIVAICYWFLYEKTCEEVLNLEEKLDETKYDLNVLQKKYDNASAIEELKVKKELYRAIFQEQNYNNLNNLENKIKTILDTAQSY